MKYKVGDWIIWKWKNQPKPNKNNIGNIVSIYGNGYHTIYYHGNDESVTTGSLTAEWVDTKQVRKATKAEIVKYKLLGYIN